MTTNLQPRSRTLDLEVDETELAGRPAGWNPPEPTLRTGVLGKCARLVGPAAQGAVCG